MKSQSNILITKILTILPTITSVLLFIASATAQAAEEPRTLKEDKRQVVVLKAKTLEEVVIDYFEDAPIMAKVAFCESTFRHYDDEGNVLRGVKVKEDVGVMQINEYYHLEDSKKLGYDIHALEGNLAYAKYLYEKEGLKPWNSSRKCWSKYQDLALAESTHTEI